MPEIYDIDFSQVANNNLPTKKRLPKWKAWLLSLLTPLQWLRDLFFNEYRKGSSAVDWDAVSTFTKGTRIRYIDNGIYEAIIAVPANKVPTNATYWIKVTDNFIGSDERVKYSGQKMTLEWALNKYFKTVFRYPISGLSDIYITNETVYIDVFTIGIGDIDSSASYLTEQYQQEYVHPYSNFSQIDFTIHIPTAVWTALGSTTAQRDNIIRRFADKYVVAGFLYVIVQY